ncbi:MAG: hypothetical protein ACRDUA_04510, partial [Micromonosporaceae bacterium]
MSGLRGTGPHHRRRLVVPGLWWLATGRGLVRLPVRRGRLPVRLLPVRLARRRVRRLARGLRPLLWALRWIRLLVLRLRTPLLPLW